MAIPPVLYKYRSLEGVAREHTRRAIVEREVWFSSLTEFNDPFEERVSVQLEGSNETWQARLGVPKPDEAKLPAWCRELEHGVREDASQIGMFCLSEVCDDILMWSHYSDQHRGVCLGFLTAAPSIFSDAQPMSYSEEYASFNYLDSTKDERGRIMLLRKAGHWQYEREWRVFRTGVGPGLEHYEAGLLCCIILGCEIQPTDREAVLRWATTVQSPLSIRQAHRSASAFSLTLENMPVVQGAV